MTLALIVMMELKGAMLLNLHVWSSSLTKVVCNTANIQHTCYYPAVVLPTPPAGLVQVIYRFNYLAIAMTCNCVH